LDGKYEVLGVIPGPIACQLGVVDLSKISEATAERLIALRNPYLRKVAPKKPTRKRPSKKEKFILGL
jgi:hypothetical protein